MSPGVFRLQPSGHAASRAHAAQVGTSVGSVDKTLPAIATPTSAALVRSSARQCKPLLEPMGGARAPWWPGSQGKSVDGNARDAREHRRQARRGLKASAWPGTALGVDEPSLGLGSAVLPWEDGHAQDRSWLAAVLGTGRAGALWMAERHVGPRALLCPMHARGAAFVIRGPRGWPLEIVSPLPPLGRGEPGHSAEPRGRVVAAQGGKHGCRRLRRTLHHATRAGAPLLYLVTH